MNTVSIKDGIILIDGSPIRCHKCGRDLTVDDLTEELPENPIYDDLYFIEDGDGCKYCKDCEDDLEECQYCGERFLKWDGMSYVPSEGGYVCDGCLDDNYSWCDDCESYHRNSEMQTVDMWDGGTRSLCDGCLEYYNICEDCGKYIYEDDTVSCDDGWICPDCEEERRKNMTIRDYHYTSEPGYGMDFLGEEHRRETPLLGVELEVEKRDGSDSWRELNEDAEEVKEAIGDDHVVICDDGSLTDGFEIISCPATLEHHKNTLKWIDGLVKLHELGYRSHDGGHCGLHVHIDREFFHGYDMEEVEGKFFLSFRNNMDWIKIFSRRRSYDYCRPNGYDDSEVNNINKFIVPPSKAWIKDKKGHGRYVAINFQNDDTIEIRIFRGTLKVQTFMATLEFVTLWADIVKEWDLGSICELNLNVFVNEAKWRGYNHFLKYIEERVKPRLNLQPTAEQEED